MNVGSMPVNNKGEDSMRNMYEVSLYKTGLVHVLADDVEDAAWQAINMCHDKDDILIDVCRLDETQ